METAIAIMLLVGCTDDMQTCKELPGSQTQFAAVDECESSIEDMMWAEAGDGRYPQILGQCVSQKQVGGEVKKVSWDVLPSGGLVPKADDGAVTMTAELMQ